MSDAHDRLHNDQGGGGSFLMGLLTGTVLGAGLGMLFAPRAGSELREQFSERTGALADRAKERYEAATETAGQWVDKGKAAASDLAERGKDAYGAARDAVSQGAHKAQDHVRDAADPVKGAGGGLPPG